MVAATVWPSVPRCTAGALGYIMEPLEADVTKFVEVSRVHVIALFAGDFGHLCEHSMDAHSGPTFYCMHKWV